MDEPEGARILIVEDDVTIARFIELELIHLGHEAFKVADGNLAVAEIERVDPDLVLLDLMLPGTDGLTIAKTLRERGHRMPILMLTARSETQDVVEGFDAGADDYLRKPFELPELLSRVRALLKRAGHDHHPVAHYQAANVEIDPASRSVLVEGQPVTLTAKEYDLLEYFVAHAGRIISRDEILEKVWGGQHVTDSNVIEVYVCHLRNKIGDSDNEIIQTIRGVGYFFARS